MADDIQDLEQALERAADAAFRTDPSYSIALAEASTAARLKQQARDLVSRKPVGV